MLIESLSAEESFSKILGKRQILTLARGQGKSDSRLVLRAMNGEGKSPGAILSG